MNIIPKSDGIFVKKDEGTEVVYHLFDEFEIHHNIVPAGTKQQWHHHKVIEEALFIVDGKLEARWKEDGALKTQIVQSGDLVRVGQSSHTFWNSSDEDVTFLVFRFVPTGKPTKDIIKNDKQLDE